MSACLAGRARGEGRYYSSQVGRGHSSRTQTHDMHFIYYHTQFADTTDPPLVFRLCRSVWPTMDCRLGLQAKCIWAWAWANSLKKAYELWECKQIIISYAILQTSLDSPHSDANLPCVVISGAAGGSGIWDLYLREHPGTHVHGDNS